MRRSERKMERKGRRAKRKRKGKRTREVALLVLQEVGESIGEGLELPRRELDDHIVDDQPLHLVPAHIHQLQLRHQLHRVPPHSLDPVLVGIDPQPYLRLFDRRSKLPRVEHPIVTGFAKGNDGRRRRQLSEEFVAEGGDVGGESAGTDGEEGVGAGEAVRGEEVSDGHRVGKGLVTRELRVREPSGTDADDVDEFILVWTSTGMLEDPALSELADEGVNPDPEDPPCRRRVQPDQDDDPIGSRVAVVVTVFAVGRRRRRGEALRVELVVEIGGNAAAEGEMAQSEPQLLVARLAMEGRIISRDLLVSVGAVVVPSPRSFLPPVLLCPARL